MNRPIRTVSIVCLLLFLALMINATYLQFYRASGLDDNPGNRRVINAAYSRERGSILVGRTPIAQSKPSHDQYSFQRTYARPYEYAPVTGYFSYFSQSGIEQSQNDVLSGDDGRLFVNRLVDLVSNQATQGGDVELTLDAKAQDAAFQGLQDLPGDAEGSVVAIEPSTGKILAMASVPSYDPNKIASHAGGFQASSDAYDRLDDDATEPLLNRATQLTLPPGSTFKLVTASAALESGDYTADGNVPGGSTYQLPGVTGSSGEIDNEGRDCGSGPIPFKQALAESCNTSFAALGVALGGDALRTQAEKYGFNSRYLQDYAPQAVSAFPTKTNTPQAGQSAIGQYDVRASTLQMAMVGAGIANQGVVMRPYLVDEVQSAESDVLSKTDPEMLSQATSASTASQLTSLMTYTVDHGTASPGAIKGIEVAGKTGTAQSGTDAPPYAWYVAFAPAKDPQVAVAVNIQRADIPRGEIAGGVYGGPIARNVMEAIIK